MPDETQAVNAPADSPGGAGSPPAHDETIPAYQAVDWAGVPGVEEAFSEQEELQRLVVPDAEPQEGDALDDVSGDGTPAEERSPYIPRARFDEVNQRYQETKSRLERLQAVEAWQPVVEALSSLNLTPEQVQAQLEALQRGTPEGTAAEPTPPDPADENRRFAEWLRQEYDIGDADWYELSSLEQRRLQREFRMEQHARQMQELAWRSAWEADLRQLAQELPAFQDPTLRGALVSFYETQYGAQPNAAQLRALANRLMNALETFHRNQLAQTAAQQQGPAPGRPAPGAQGTPPSPSENLDWITNASDDEFSDRMLGVLRGMLRGRR